MRNVTQYLLNAIKASSNGAIEFKETKKDGKNFIEITKNELESGIVTNKLELHKFLKSKMQSKNENKYEIVICLKTIATEFFEGAKKENNNLESMTGIFFLPAKIDEDGNLQRNDNKHPWIPREYMSPMIDEQISIGDVNDYNNFLEKSTYIWENISTWQEYFEYAKKMFVEVSHIKSFDDCYLHQAHIKTDSNFYIFKDETVNSTYHIRTAYDNLLNNVSESALYSKMTNMEIEPSTRIDKKISIQQMLNHCGQMNGEYPLSPSQRESISYFNEIKDGEVLAVSGPPGTGKTTLLQSIVADMYVKAAINKKDAPIILAASTNNQAVTNIIESFGKINSIGIGNLENRWINNIHSFAVYFPSKIKINEAKDKNFHYTNMEGEYFFDEIEDIDNRVQSTDYFKNQFKIYFESDSSLSSAKEIIHQNLISLDDQRKESIIQLNNIKNFLGEKTFEEYQTYIQTIISNIDKQITNLDNQKEKTKNFISELTQRKDEWVRLYNNIFPWHIRFFKFFLIFKNKISKWINNNKNKDEIDFLNKADTIEEIKHRYNKTIQSHSDTVLKIEEQRSSLVDKKNDTIKELENIRNKISSFEKILHSFSDYKIRLKNQKITKDTDIDIDNITISDLNDALDGIRYIEFWLAVHYFEALWLYTDNPISENQKGKTFENVLKKFFRRLAMITPCMVMTCYMLPKNFLAYSDNNKKKYHFYNYSDLLIVDEAGQVSPEIGLPSFAFAKKAIVVGDEQQIPPVWNTSRALDITMAITSGVINDKDEYKSLEKNGLNCSESSIMKVATLSCQFEKYGKGLFLSEHRRCYDEIIEYCNELVYDGKLKPMRGAAFKDAKYKLKNYLPPIGHKQINSDNSDKIGSSRCNEAEAQVIVGWIQDNYDILCEKYGTDSDILGVITPFKQQSVLIKKLLYQQIPELKGKVDVGTVHTFQGGERKVIIFSCVYGKNDSCYFINHNKSLMNVAVSRAKDSFLVFGDKNCLSDEISTASGLLKSKIKYKI